MFVELGGKVLDRPKWPTEKHGYREEPSFPEKILNLFGQRIVEIVWYGKLAFSRT
jgi:hypothetical protein